MPMSSNAVLHQENWEDNQSPHVETVNGNYKVGGTKIKMGAATSTNFMKGTQGITS